MIFISVITVLLATLLLFILIMRTRGHDSVLWWLYRILITYAMICFLYLAYDTGVEGQHIEPKFLFIRMGCLALVVAMLITRRLMKLELATKPLDFDQHLNNILNKER